MSIACCVSLSHCRERPLEQSYLIDKVCSSWLASFESASYYYCHPANLLWGNDGIIFVPHAKVLLQPLLSEVVLVFTTKKYELIYELFNYEEWKYIHQSKKFIHVYENIAAAT